MLHGATDFNRPLNYSRHCVETGDRQFFLNKPHRIGPSKTDDLLSSSVHYGLSLGFKRAFIRRPFVFIK
jgi:hypothetical protein